MDVKQRKYKRSTRNSRHRKTRLNSKSRPQQHYPLLCFDTETTNHGELLELSIFDQDGNEVFHQYFRPRADSWPTHIHHISPEMVSQSKRFSAWRHEVERILNSTDHLVGCALSNDLHTLHRYGVNLHGRHKVLDIQNLYWLLHDTSERHEKYQTGLAAIAAHYGLDFGEEQAHSASADTKLTLNCFKRLAENVVKTYGEENCEEEITDEWLKKLGGIYSKKYAEAMQEFRMHGAAGFVNVVKREQGYSIKSSRFEPDNVEKYVLSVAVNDRDAAEKELREHFSHRQLKGFTGIFDFKPQDYDYIRNYSNTLDLDTFIEREKEKNARKQKPSQEKAIAKGRHKVKTRAGRELRRKSNSGTN